MKTYLINLPKSLNLISEKLDAKSILCNKPWLVFNDEGYKQVLIFQKDGSLIVSNNGEVVNSKWSYISANKSLLITIAEKTYMFHPAFLDKAIFALKQDGKDECLFMIDENNILSFLPKSLKELDEYLAKQIIKEEIELKKEKNKEQQLEERKELVLHIKNEYKEELKKLKRKQVLPVVLLILYNLLICMIILVCITFKYTIIISVVGILSCIIEIFGFVYIVYAYNKYDENNFIEKILKEVYQGQ